MEPESIHEYVQRAIDAPKPKNLVNHSYKVDPNYLAAGTEILAKQGLTIGAFHRQCLKALVDDYLPRSIEEDSTL